MTTFTPSAMQLAIFNAIQATTDNLAIEAVAGSGKTTTICTAVKYLPQNEHTVLLAFNKAIAEELRSRDLPASTFHALCFGALRKLLPKNVKVSAYKVNDILKTIISEDLADDYRDVSRLVSLAKNAMLTNASSKSEWLDLCGDFTLDFPDVSTAIGFAQRALRNSNEVTSIIDFDDMLYFAVTRNLTFPQYDNILVDEAQDLNAIQRVILARLGHDKTRYIFVGDRHQAIYGFRGAGSESFSALVRDFNCTQLPLSVSYRCAQDIVAEAQSIVPHIQAHSTALKGSVAYQHEWRETDIVDHSAILCRNMRPLISVAYKLLAVNRQVVLNGRDFAAMFKRMVTPFVKLATIDEVIAALIALRDEEIAKAMDANFMTKAAMIEDKYNALILICRAAEYPSVIIKQIDFLFTPRQNAIICTTIHRAKGLEWDTVYFLDVDLIPSRYAVSTWQLEQEKNLQYVGITRAKTTLNYISSSAFSGDSV